MVRSRTKATEFSFRNGLGDKRSTHAGTPPPSLSLSLSEYISAYNIVCLSKKIAGSVIAISIEHYTVPAKAGRLPRHQLEILHQAHLPEKKEIRDYGN